MTSVKVTCEECGDLELGARDIVARVCADTGDSQYRFRCPTCAFTTVRDIAHQFVGPLEAAGTRVDIWQLPRELSERHTGPNVNHCDLIDFHEAIQDPELFELALEKLAEASAK